MTQVELLRNLILVPEKYHLCCSRLLSLLFQSDLFFSLQSQALSGAPCKGAQGMSCGGICQIRPALQELLEHERAVVIWPVHLEIYNVYIRMEVYLWAKKT